MRCRSRKSDYSEIINRMTNRMISKDKTDFFWDIKKFEIIIRVFGKGRDGVSAPVNRLRGLLWSSKNGQFDKII